MNFYFKEFLETRFHALEFVEPIYKPKIVQTNANNPKVLHTVSNITCPHCSENHRLYNCKKFSQENVDKRRSIAESLSLCFNCLGINHNAKNCRVFNKCHVCKRRHHTLLHPKDQATADVVATTSQVEEVEDSPQSAETPSNIASHFLNGSKRGQVLLPTAIIKAESKNGSIQVLRALLDQGSHASFISEAAVQLLQLKKVPSKCIVSGVGGTSNDKISKNVVVVNLQSRYDPSFKIQVTARVVDTVTSLLSAIPIVSEIQRPISNP